MGSRRTVTAVGTGLTTVLVVSVAVIELLNVEFSALVGLPVGVLAGVVAFLSLWDSLDELSPFVRRVASAYATFGLTVVLLLALRYVNVARGTLSVEVIAGVAIAVAILTYLGLWLTDRAVSD
ncbi:hypothetical protein [Halovenus marina]|uniref:hypothetical protein n=1 Tax=Halovenus marina TaxID=3396621 RepID=UPI003F57DED6